MNKFNDKNIFKKTKILFLGFAISESLMKEISQKDSYPQIAAHKLQWNIIRGIEESTGQAVNLASAIPVSDYPRYPGVFFRYSKWKHSQDSHDHLMPFINVMILKHVTRFLSSFFLVAAWLFKNRHSEQRSILIYAMHSPFVLASIFATRILGGKAFLLIPDLPEFMDLGIRKSFMRKIAKTIDSLLLMQMVKRMAGLIVLTKYAATDIDIGNVPFIVMEGAVSYDQMIDIAANDQLSEIYNQNEKIVMYAGTLTGLELLLDAFALIKDESYRLWICGRGEMEEQLKAASASDKRIIYWGILSNEELLKKKSRATVLINARSSRTPYIKYSFPSKLLEYMITGRPVISTDLPGIPAEYKEYLFMLDIETPETLAAFIQEICAKSKQDLSAFGQRAKEFVLKNKNCATQGKRVYDFIHLLTQR